MLRHFAAVWVFCGVALGQEVTNAVTPPVPTYQPNAEFSPEAQLAGVTASVRVTFQVAIDGVPVNVGILRGAGFGLDEKAVDAVKRWRFKPAQKDGSVVSIQMESELRFGISNTGNTATPPAARLTFSLPAGADRPALLKGASLALLPDPPSSPIRVEFDLAPDGKVSNVHSSAPAPEKLLAIIRNWRFSEDKKRAAKVAAQLELTYRTDLSSNSVAPAAGAYKIGNGVSSPKAVVKPEPDYSAEARGVHATGTIRLSLVVGEDGKPRDIQVTRPMGFGLDDKAVEAVNLWRFEPGQKGGKAVPVQAVIEITFHLLDKGVAETGLSERLMFVLPPGSSRPILQKGASLAVKLDSPAATMAIDFELAPTGRVSNVHGTDAPAKLIDIVRSWQFSADKTRPEKVAGRLEVTYGAAAVGVPPIPVTAADPQYTKEGLTAGVAAVVHLVVAVNEKGVPTEVQLEKGAGFGLDEVAIESVRRWRFRPGTRDGKPAPVKIRIDVAFKWANKQETAPVARLTFDVPERAVRPVLQKGKRLTFDESPGPLRVQLEFDVARDGTVSNVHATEGEQAKVLDAVRGWRFSTDAARAEKVVGKLELTY